MTPGQRMRSELAERASSRLRAAADEAADTVRSVVEKLEGVGVPDPELTAEYLLQQGREIAGSARDLADTLRELAQDLP